VISNHQPAVSQKRVAKKASEARALRLHDNAEGLAVLAVLDRIAAAKKPKSK